MQIQKECNVLQCIAALTKSVCRGGSFICTSALEQGRIGRPVCGPVAVGDDFHLAAECPDARGGGSGCPLRIEVSIRHNEGRGEGSTAKGAPPSRGGMGLSTGDQVVVGHR